MHRGGRRHAHPDQRRNVHRWPGDGARLRLPDASERAVFADNHSRVGILPGGGMTARLPRLVGLAMARRLSMTGEVVDAARVEPIGLVTEVVAHARLLERALELAGQIGEVPAAKMAALKGIFTTGAAPMIDPALAAEAEIAFAQHRDFDGLGD
ncbi:enoyl-CoA hydratase/carnithine racemase [Mycobacterium sp. URHB0021]